MKNKSNVGIHHNRQKRELMEAAFALTWETFNVNNAILSHLFVPNSQPANPVKLAVINDQQNEEAATLIQWLGSPVGLCFLRDVQEMATKLKEEGFKE